MKNLGLVTVTFLELGSSCYYLVQESLLQFLLVLLCEGVMNENYTSLSSIWNEENRGVNTVSFLEHSSLCNHHSKNLLQFFPVLFHEGVNESNPTHCKVPFAMKKNRCCQSGLLGTYFFIVLKVCRS